MTTSAGHKGNSLRALVIATAISLGGYLEETSQNFAEHTNF